MFKIRSLVFVLALLITNQAHAQTKNIVYYSKDHFLVQGTNIPFSEKEHPYDRLPFSYKEKVREPVWRLSKESAGLSVRFISNTTTIKVKWELLYDTQMNHMAPTGSKGLDLYCRVDNQWQFVNTARPTGKENEFMMVQNMPAEEREFRIFMPLYDCLVNLEIGVDSLSSMIKPAKSDKKPIVFYGTSITQGGCASRPGMAYSNIISRKLDVDCINFGFSGNGRMEAPIAEVISEIDAFIYVIDCIPNMNPEMIHANMIPMVEIIRRKNPATPMVFMESTWFERSYFDEAGKNNIDANNKALKIEFDKLVEKGYTNIYLIHSKAALGQDHEATVDGVHFTDLGFMRFADYLISGFKMLGLI